MTIEATEVETDWWWAALFMACGTFLMFIGAAMTLEFIVNWLLMALCWPLGECP